MPIVAVRPTCLAQCARCCMQPFVPRDTSTLVRAAYRLPNAKHTFLGCIARCSASFAGCSAALLHPLLCSAPLHWEVLQTTNNSSQCTWCVSEWTELRWLLSNNHWDLQWRSFLIKCGIVNLVLRQNQQASLQCLHLLQKKEWSVFGEQINIHQKPSDLPSCDKHHKYSRQFALIKVPRAVRLDKIRNKTQGDLPPKDVRGNSPRDAVCKAICLTKEMQRRFALMKT